MLFDEWDAIMAKMAGARAPRAATSMPPARGPAMCRGGIGAQEPTQIEQVFVARPTGVGRAGTQPRFRCILIEGADEWGLAAEEGA